MSTLAAPVQAQATGMVVAAHFVHAEAQGRVWKDRLHCCIQLLGAWAGCAVYTMGMCIHAVHSRGVAS